MRAKLALLASVGILSLALAGCGGGKAGSGTAEKPGQAAQGQEQQGGTQPSDPAKGKVVFSANCASCHGPDGKGGQGFIGPAFASVDGKPPVKQRLSEADHLQVVRKGRLDKGMPAWEGVLKEQEILDVVAYERSLD